MNCRAAAYLAGTLAFGCGPAERVAHDIDSGSSSEPDALCPAIDFVPMPVTPSIGLVLDRSNSMALTDIVPTRFAAMRDALVGASGVVAQLQSKAYFGSLLYTCYNSLSLDLHSVPRALDNAAAISASIDGSGGPGGNTPTAAAIDAMVAEFTAKPPPPGSPPVIVLATDGAPNDCASGQDQSVYDEWSVAAARASFMAGIPVYVLAIAQNSQHFQNVANAGQGSTTNVTYYPVTNAAGLQAAFQAIINGVISCDLTLTRNIDANAATTGTVTVNGVQLVYGTDWILVNGNIIRLLGAACDSFKSSPDPMIAAQFPCDSVIL